MKEVLEIIKSNSKDLKIFLKKIVYGEIQFDWSIYSNLYEKYMDSEIIDYLLGDDIEKEDLAFSNKKDYILIDSFNEMYINLSGNYILAKDEEVIKNLEILLKSFEDILDVYNKNSKNIDNFFN